MNAPMTMNELNAILANARMNGKTANLRGANLRGANLQGADLWDANLQGANLRGADLQGANLQGANLRDANLQGADLRGADLQGANLQGANLRGANLRGANLRDANLILIGQDIRGYLFYAWHDNDNTVVLCAGCRRFVGIDAAYAHWNARHMDDAILHEDCLSLIARCEHMATLRGWKLRVEQPEMETT